MVRATARGRVTQRHRSLDLASKCICMPKPCGLPQQEQSSFSSARWPSGLRRQLKAVITHPSPGLMVQFAGPKGRGFKSHSGQLFCHFDSAQSFFCSFDLVRTSADVRKVFKLPLACTGPGTLSQAPPATTLPAQGRQAWLGMHVAHHGHKACCGRRRRRSQKRLLETGEWSGRCLG